ncbi:MAG: GNAT family N-acetyltransferase [Devosia sp.]|uniref:GNAT family N-acetyltransferase n=1 Tax=Devosia sp. TaxID=1871048 RepID=UPI001A5CC8AB|nr:GNAT family N-acetyltransferase [Devosia sp.]MBL8597935.1 GNAT family N-acetyltransferase [Devosia sp.]
MRRDLDAPLADAPLPAALTLLPFDIDTARLCRELMNYVYADGFGDSAVAFDAWWTWVTTDADYAPELMFVAAEQGRVVGFCHCWRDGFIKDLVVDRAWRKRGLGAALLTMALAASTARGIPFVDLKTDVDNATAQSLYRHLGFRIVERVG